MRPIRTPQTDVVLTLPGGTERNDLPAERVRLFDAASGETEADARPGIITTWQPTHAERQELAGGAPVRLTVWGHGHPPVALGIGSAPDGPERLLPAAMVYRALGGLYGQLNEDGALDTDVGPADFVDAFDGIYAAAAAQALEDIADAIAGEQDNNNGKENPDGDQHDDDDVQP